jgi:hypothetical protein
LLDTKNTNINSENDTLHELENDDVYLSSSEGESELPEEKNEINSMSLKQSSLNFEVVKY